MSQNGVSMKVKSIDFAKIVEIRRVREEIEELSEYESQLSSPMGIDGDSIDRLYEIFCSIVARRNQDIGQVMLRKQFIFIALYIYAPGVLAGDNLPRGLRGRLSSVLKIESRSTISNNCADLIFLYQNYKSFQDNVSEIFIEIMEIISKDESQITA